MDKSLKSLTDKRSEEIKVRCNKITVEQIMHQPLVTMDPSVPGNNVDIDLFAKPWFMPYTVETFL